MYKLLPCIFSIVLCFSKIDAQPKNPIENTSLKKVIITGKVIDKETQEPLEYATISFFSKEENKIETGGITDVNGDFSILVRSGTYDISIEYISFKTITLTNKKLTSSTNIGTIFLELSTESLDEVEIIAERTTVELKLDKKIYNVGKDLTVRGGTVSDVLDNVPSVSVDVEGNVSLRGQSNVRILINGKPSGLVGLNSTAALRQLPAESIERVEVITSPSARYDAEGTAGILNIILRRSKLLGTNGAITVNGGLPKSAGVSTNINHRTGDINIFNTTSYRYSESPGYSYSRNYTKDTQITLEEDQDTERIRKGLTTNFGTEWYITDSASLTGSITWSNSDNERNTTNTINQYDENLNLISTGMRRDPELEDDKRIQYALNFDKQFDKSGHKFTLDFQYEDNTEDENSLIIVNNELREMVATLEDQTQILLQTDYVLPIGENSQFEMGYRGNFDNTSTDYIVEILNDGTNNFEKNTDLSNLLNFKQYVNAAYTQFGSKINKFSFLLGLRMESTRITIDQPTSGDFDKKNYTGLFPTINLNYEFSEDENITLGYNRRLSRPRSFFLNPFPSRASLTSVFQGNPDLDPSYSGKLDLGYYKKFGKLTLTTSAYYQHETDAFSFVSFDTGEDVLINGEWVNVIQRGPINLATEDRLGFEFTFMYRPTKKWNLNTNFNLFNRSTKGTTPNGLVLDKKNTSWFARLNNKYTLPGNIDWQTTFYYSGPSEDAQNKNKGRLYSNIAFSKDLFKEKASLALSVSDLFNSSIRKTNTTTPTYTGYSEFQWRMRSLNLSFTYRFNQKKKPQRSRGDFDGGGGEMEM